MPGAATPAWSCMAILAAALLGPAPAAAADFADPLDTAALPVASPSASPVLALAAAGARLVAAGMRGVIITSDDGGQHWAQAAVPVQSDLTALSFPTPDQGWAVGHDGVVLHSADGGAHWSKQLDGRAAAERFTASYRARIDAGDASLQADLDQVAVNFKDGPSLPYLDVCFESSAVGYAVGSFGMIAQTDDGGRTWRPWLDHIDNPDALNLNAVRLVDGVIYIAGERGMVYRLDRRQARFVRLATGYAGSFFGITGSRDALVAYGLRGAIYRSADQGEHWSAVAAPTQATLTGSAILPDGSILLADEAGNLLSGSGVGAAFALALPSGGHALTGVLGLGAQQVALAGLAGMAIRRLPR